MKWGVGLAVGNKRSIAAIARPDSELVTLERESVLHHAPDGTVQLGGTAAGSTGLRGFLDRVGTEDTDNFSEHMTRGEELVATAMYCLVKEVRTLTDQNVNISAVIPAGWSSDSVDVLRGALDSMNLDGVELISEDEASAAWLADPDADDRAARGAAALAAPFSITSTCPEPQPTEFAEPENTPEELPPFVLIEPEPESGVEAPVTKEPSIDGWLNRQWRSERRPIIAAAAAAVFLTVSGCAAAVIIGHTPTISAPGILDAQSSLSPGTDTAATPTSSSGTGTQSATSPPPEVPALGAQPTAQSWASEAESTSSESQPIPVSPGTGTEKSTTANVPAQQGSPITIQIDPLRIENLPPVVGPLDPVDPDTPDTPAVTDPTDTQTTPTQPSNATDTTDPVVPNPDMPVMPSAPRPGMPS
ncbi:hypothetical protein LRQ08_06660 [Rhodococcus qingshengii]|jgi:hypothetical protein|uniref:hypothetical protein n=1 Tax=Rhodococcus qingshengii TaxID=334542 RepID=UPI002112CB45|nr:hypothetical protein [Rhodococcus qingshengii]UUE26530.1 hypothetical protein LRQ08_06660 [Rhodococcus qingshengii]